MAPQTVLHKTSDGQTLSGQKYVPDKNIKGAVVLTHGYAEYAGRYTHVIAQLNAHGFAGFTFDLRGHGASSGKRAYIASFDEYIRDLSHIYDWARTEVGEVPCFLYGHSMGGLISTLFALHHQPAIAGVVLSSAALKISDDLAPLLQKVAGVLGAILPTLPTISLDISTLCLDPAVVAAYEADPLVYRGGTRARTAAEILAATKRLMAQEARFTWPVYLAHGTADKITDPAGSQRFHDAIASTDKTLITYDGEFHEIHNGPNQNEFLTGVTNWLTARCA